ncbi:MAG: amidase [Gammaproteobacteria bacterium]|nr:amidase [Gammaproteobacteria bacterium]MDH3371844.1 amidase [Gammaproteobacteria bacterium]
MTDLELCYLEAVEALRLFRSRALSPVDLLEAQIARAQEVEGRVNAFATTRYEQALQQARLAEQRYAKGGELRALEGIPTVLKNEHTLVGDNTNLGSTLLTDAVDEENAPVTDRLLDAGAVIQGKSNVPEFLCAIFTWTKLYGATATPWNLEANAGGSSGGSAAALASGTTTLATGSDIGGSIRIPACFNGVVGFKPTYGRVPEADPVYAFNPYNHNGVLAHTVRDCSLMFDVLHGPDPRDMTTLAPKLDVPDAFGNIRGRRIALSIDLGYYAVDPVIERNTRNAASALSNCGAKVVEVELPWTRRAGQAAADNLAFTMGKVLAANINGMEESVCDYVVELARLGEEKSIQDYHSSLELAAEMFRSLADVFDDCDALLCPTMAVPRLPLEGVTPHLPTFLEAAMTYPFNMLSRCPVLSIPSGFSDCGVPTGVQIVGRPYADLDALTIGANLERELDWRGGRRPFQANSATVS